jgi:hypothetical protein
MRRMMALLAGLIVFVVAACRESELAAGVDESTFVATMAALHRVNASDSLTNEDKERARDSVLQGRGLTPEQLSAAAEALGRDPDRALAVWRRITVSDSEDSTARRPMPFRRPR